MFYYAYTYNKIFKLNRQSGKLEKSYTLTGLRPYFIANKNFIYGIINDAKRILILNLNLEQMTEISYDDAYDKIFFNTNGSDLILRSCKTPFFLNV
jgi:hypothetical protein